MSNISAITGANGTPTPAATASNTGKNQTLGQDAFLKLLVTQMTNQDPTAPTDNSQFLAQLAQFSTVEGVNNMSTSQSHTQAQDLLGKTINANVIQNNMPTSVTGKVTSVKWDATGVHLKLDSTTTDVTLAEVQQVTAP